MTLSPQTWIAIALAVAAFAGGWFTNGWRLDAEIGRLETARAEDIARAEKQVQEALVRARAAEQDGQAQAARVLAAEGEAARIGKEKDHVLRELADRRPCLSAPVVRVLNAGTLPAAPGVSPAPGGAARAAPGAAADSDDAAASDEDVALWARDARDQYDACRARIAALRRFHGVP
jgi:hypothetical protein